MPFRPRPKLEYVTACARRWNCHKRTIYRWLNDGVDPEDHHAVAAYLLTQKNPSQSALNELRNFLILEAHQTTTTNELHHQAN